MKVNKLIKALQAIEDFFEDTIQIEKIIDNHFIIIFEDTQLRVCLNDKDINFLIKEFNKEKKKQNKFFNKLFKKH